MDSSNYDTKIHRIGVCLSWRNQEWKETNRTAKKATVDVCFSFSHELIVNEHNSFNNGKTKLITSTKHIIITYSNLNCTFKNREL
jgi:hypothetical protein